MTNYHIPSYLKFDKQSYPGKPDIDYRKEPQKYRVGKGEQGVLICEPYKSELMLHWRFQTPEIAEKSSTLLYKIFEDYLEADDFVGADLARKFLQMGYTRARRYAHYKSGIKYDKNKDYALEEKRHWRSAESRKRGYFLSKMEAGRSAFPICLAQASIVRHIWIIWVSNRQEAWSPPPAAGGVVM